MSAQTTPGSDRGELKPREANKSVSADRALMMGLVHEVFPDESFDDDVMAFCRHLAKQNGEQMGIAKIAIEMARDVGLAQTGMSNAWPPVR